jgi:hypothetical protein
MAPSSKDCQKHVRRRVWGRFLQVRVAEGALFAIPTSLEETLLYTGRRLQVRRKD